MKYFLCIFTLVLSCSSWAKDLELEVFDQGKLADLLAKISTDLKAETVSDISEPLEGKRVHSEFPLEDDRGFKIVCDSDFFLQSPVASYSKCVLSLDEANPLLLSKNEEWKIILDDKVLAEDLFNNISYGQPNKDFRSYGKDKGKNFNGKYSFIFHYRFDCSKTSCQLFFSKIIGRDEDDSKIMANPRAF